MASTPRVSVLVPCFNEENAVDETIHKLDAALSPLGDFEIVAIDDGSVDRTL